MKHIINYDQLKTSIESNQKCVHSIQYFRIRVKIENALISVIFSKYISQQYHISTDLIYRTRHFEFLTTLASLTFAVVHEYWVPTCYCWSIKCILWSKIVQMR